jgi:hypothetical protein
MKKLFLIPGLIVLVSMVSCEKKNAGSISPGPLRISANNPAYFTDFSGKAVYLTGSHTWNNLVDMVNDESDSLFDYPVYMEWMKRHNHNFSRLWAWELLNWDTRGNREINARVLQVFPHPWARTGPGLAIDGNPKFDLRTYDESYFTRLKERVTMAEKYGMYVSVMLFEGWGLQFSPNGYKNHPFHPDNNINGINGDVNGDGSGVEIHTLENPEVLAIQEDYVKKVINTINDSDYVLYEIANETQGSSTEWQYHMIRLIKDFEKKLPKQHPVGMTFQHLGGTNEDLFNSPADWISPNPEGGYRDDPPANDGSKVIITDTDHLWGIGGNSTWVWKSMMRGLNPIFMDPYDQQVLSGSYDPAWVEPLRKSLGYSKMFMDSIDLRLMFPDTTSVSTQYCLSDPGEAYLVLLPEPGSVSIDLGGINGTFSCNWFDPAKGSFVQAEVRQGGGKLTVKPPYPEAPDNILLLRKVAE